MASPGVAAAAGGGGEGEKVTGEMVSAGFVKLERQQLLASCTWLYQQLSEQFSSPERGLTACSETIRHKHHAVEAHTATARALDELRCRELSIDGSVS